MSTGNRHGKWTECSQLGIMTWSMWLLLMCYGDADSRFCIVLQGPCCACIIAVLASVGEVMSPHSAAPNVYNEVVSQQRLGF